MFSMKRSFGLAVVGVMLVAGWTCAQWSLWQVRDFRTEFLVRLKSEGLDTDPSRLDRKAVRVVEINAGGRTVCAELASSADVPGGRRLYGMRFFFTPLGPRIDDLSSPHASNPTDLAYLQSVCS